jgi:cytochrome c oxidase subunit 2
VAVRWRCRHPRLKPAGAAALILSLCLARVARAETPSISNPASPNAAALADLYNVILFIAIGVFLLVQGLIIYAALNFRRRASDPEPVQVHGNTRIELVWTLVPLVIVIVITLLSYRTLRATATPASADALVINVIGHQWWWEFQHTDPDFATANELVVPVGRLVRLNLASADVIHSFWVPQLAGKMDLVPGVQQGEPRHLGYGQNALWFVAQAEGRYEGQCAEFCGAQHSGMRLTIVAKRPPEYEAWLAVQQAPAEAPAAGSAAARGLELMKAKGCQGCHAIDGVPEMVGRVGPDLTHVASRERLAGGTFENTTANLTSWVDNPQQLKPGALMPELPVSAAEIADIVAYLESLR